MREIELQGLPVVAVVERNPNAIFCAGKQKAFADGIFAHSVDGSVIGQAVRDRLPSFSAVMRAINVRMQIVDAETADGSVGRLLIEMRRGHLRYFAPWADFRGSDVRPFFFSVASDPKSAAVGPSPQRVQVFEGWRQRVNLSALLFRFGIFRGHAAQACRDAGLLTRKIGTDGLPGFAAIGGLEQNVGGVIENVRIDRREHDRLSAISAVFRAAVGNGRDVLYLSGARVKPGDLFSAGAVNKLGIERIGRNVTIFDGSDRVPVPYIDFAIVAAAGNAD